MKSFDCDAASAVDEPEMPAKKIDSSDVDLREPAGEVADQRPRNRTSRSVIPPTFMRFAVSRKNGTASRMNELYALNVSCISVIGERRGPR